MRSLVTSGAHAWSPAAGSDGGQARDKRHGGQTGPDVRAARTCARSQAPTTPRRPPSLPGQGSPPSPRDQPGSGARRARARVGRPGAGAGSSSLSRSQAETATITQSWAIVSGLVAQQKHAFVEKKDFAAAPIAASSIVRVVCVVLVEQPVRGVPPGAVRADPRLSPKTRPGSRTESQ